jgi:hypothetical protein
MYLSAVPAYGRDYKSKKAVMEDWNSGKDFLIQDMRHGGYVNKDDKPEDVTLHIRYDRMTKVLPVK